MAVTGVHHLYVQTRNWGATVAFWQELGFTLAFETGHGSGQLTPPGGGPYVFVEEVGDDVEPVIQISLAAAGDESPGEPVQVVAGFTPTHWGTQVMELRDPDGRMVNLEAPAG